MDYFTTSLHHLLAELERIDLLIQLQIVEARKFQKDDDQFRGLYISEEELDALLRQPIGRPRWSEQVARGAGDVESLLAEISERIESCKQESLDRGIELRLQRLQNLFQLERFEVDTLLVCLAVEVDLRYERLYAYLQDDVTKKRPSVDLVLNLLAPSAEEKFRAREYFNPDARLFEHCILELFNDPPQLHPPLLASYLKVDKQIAGYLLGSDEIHHRVQSYVTNVNTSERSDQLVPPEEVNNEMVEVLRAADQSTRFVVHLKGPYGVGKQELAHHLCHDNVRQLIIADLARIASDSDSTHEQTFALINREAWLKGAALYWKGFDVLLEDKNKPLFETFLRSLNRRPCLTFLVGERSWEPSEALRDLPFADVDLQRPSYASRLDAWSTIVRHRKGLDADLDLGALASTFKFTGGQIQDAAATAANLARWRSASGKVTMKDLYEACRLHSNQSLSALGKKVTPKYAWHDIVLPPDRFEQLREMCNYVKYQDRVYVDWGFEEKLSLGKGLSVLFAGPSGTGKTMAAEIIAGDLGLDLYKIDLSTVVSKYIGETEKNLSRIFTEAETSNAILFFDEADALFGKRSEVRDSHDRYANIEIGYLLQRMEEYEGIVILATNLRKNMDEAFVRRLHFTVEFPFPNAEDRFSIWERIWPEKTPRDSLDLTFMAERFELTGGSIRNIALGAAFLAVDDGETVTMEHLIRATRREYQKMGKVMAEGKFAGRPSAVSGVDARTDGSVRQEGIKSKRTPTNPGSAGIRTPISD